MKLFKLSILGKTGKAKRLVALLFLFSFCLYGQVALATTYVTVQPYGIKFNYEAGYSNDALTISDYSGETITSPEWAYGCSPDSFAYIMGQSDRNIQVQFSSNCSSMHLIINLTVTSGTGIGTVCNHFEANYTALDWITLELDGNISGSVGRHNFTWQWSVYAIPNDDAYCSATSTNSTSHTYYTLLAVPQAPMDEPWSSVLDYACDWASGQTTEYYIISSITEGAYDNIGKEYYGGDSHAVLPNFNLTGFFADDWADCRDMSAVVQIFSNALGAQSIQVRRIDGQFVYKLILPIGKYNWTSGTWNFHQVGYYSNVFDACLQLDQSSPRIPINEQINGSYKNDLFDSGYWTPNNATAYTYVY
ncbi:MAG: hypothetical protein K9H26_06510 [Prolixibacteraceae bacterium]|nr:hypothetical protein [Prolixibacteraceae bacterium]